MASWRWVDELQKVLQELGGRAHLDEIEQQIRKQGRKPLANNKTLQSTISSYLQYYSSDSTTYWEKGDFFHLVERGSGIWELREAPQKPIAPPIENTHPVHIGGSKRGKTQDQEKKAMVEKVAILTCCSHFEKQGYTVESVEKDNVGWDLVATKNRSKKLLIEVKGLSGEKFSVELTPNEYNAFKTRDSNYRLAVVVNALDNPLLSICRYSEGAWIIEGEECRMIEVVVRESASITAQ